MAKDHGSSIKNDEQYEELRDEGMSKSKAARIANDPKSGKKGGKADKYEERTREELYEKAQEIGIEGRSDMDKDELIKALRNH
ncbi:Rho termination factor, N-terminal domain [Salegentibacter echinorum]|uniref:Rho termination factor, N-terminal domain n=1 Tax=Salegentibacter echinorum TaxID=1073325 RepID=A0A1M5LAM8_SALEC|nr:Rho termination factor N-terminal domain-containing protein [Salegentibacter echinorum]SHG62046.1 Rho termination factor, N-terminal domain [Salegentibacter echinorum]